MAKSKPFYITTTLPYVNAPLHIGHALEFVRADSIARYKKLLGYDVFFNTGTDEHGKKILESARAADKEPKEYVDEYFPDFKKTLELLHISEEVNIIRTTDPRHEEGAVALWRACRDKGFIYKGRYQAKYCVGCELEKTDSELVNGRCSIHPDRELELIDEENYFFAFSKTAPLIEKLYTEKSDLVIPEFRFNEMKMLLKNGLKDFSISRLKEKMPWGVAVPDDPDHVMYVWFDALSNYIAAVGYPTDMEKFNRFWRDGTPVQYCGKDNVRQQSMMWQSMLLAADLPTTRHIVIDGFINSGGQKMSKSLGNVLSPKDLIEHFRPAAGELSTDVLRYYLLRHVNSFEDSDMTLETVVETYNANLANGLGNLVSRILTMASSNDVRMEISEMNAQEEKNLEEFQIDKYMNSIWEKVQMLDKSIQEKEPFKKIKTNPKEAKNDITEMLSKLAEIAYLLRPTMPQTAETVLALLKENKKPEKPLFGRI